MWETYVEPTLERQKEFQKTVGATGSQPAEVLEDTTPPPTLEGQIAAAQAAGMMFQADPIEVGKAMRKSWPPTEASIDELRAKLQARNAK